MKTKLFLLLFISGLLSCNSGKFYANYRAGGKMDREEKTVGAENISQKDSLIIKSPENNLTEITITDTLLVQNLPGNKKMAILKEKKITVENKNVIPQNDPSSNKKNKSVNSKQTINKKSVDAELHSVSFSHSPFKSSSSAVAKFLLAAVIIGLIVFFISNSVGAGIITVLLFIAGGIIGAALAIGLVLWLIGQMIGEIINSSNRSYKKNKSIFNGFKSVDHGARIATFFWILVGLSLLTGLLMALIMIPNFWVIALAVAGGIAAALLIGAILAGFLDLIMPGDSMFSKQPENNRIGKIFSRKTKKGPMKYYGGMPIWLFFVICVAIGILALILAGSWGAPLWVIDSIITGMVTMGVLCLLCAAINGIFEGIAR